MKKPIVILALPKHDDAFTSTPYQLAVEFSRSSPVLYVSHPYSWLDCLRHPLDPRLLKRLRASFTGGSIEWSGSPTLMVLILPLILPINWLPTGKIYDRLSRFNHWLVSRAINKAAAKQELSDYVFINSHDYYFADIHQQLIRKSKYIYQCIDPIVKSYSARHGKSLEARAASSADLVISTSPYLRERMASYNTNSYLVPNAANFSLCHQATDAATTTLQEIDRLPGLKFGYVGNIERRINYQLLIDVFKTRTDWHLIMVGPLDKTYVPSDFTALPNVTFLPSVSHGDVPRVLKSIDIAIIPFLCDEVSAQIYPLKMYEYLASGKPVITTNFNPEVIEALADVVSIADSPREFAGRVSEITHHDNASLRERRIAVARANDWSQRSEVILELIASTEQPGLIALKAEEDNIDGKPMAAGLIR